MADTKDETKDAPRSAAMSTPRQAPRESPRMGAGNIAASTSDQVGATTGDADTTADLVKPKKGVAECPNCKRSWPVRDGDTGSILPCLCGFQIAVA